MSRIRGKHNATTELKLVSLFRVARVRGWRRNFPLPGKPDFVFPKSKLAVFVDGCFWHGHGCGRNLKPKCNASLWREKFATNRRRDARVTRALRGAGWQVIRIGSVLCRSSQIFVLCEFKTLCLVFEFFCSFKGKVGSDFVLCIARAGPITDIAEK